MLENLRFYISPVFLSKYYLKQDVQKALNDYRFDGKILDYGCGQKPYGSMFTDCKDYIGIDLPAYSLNADMHSGSPDILFSKDYLKTFKLPFEDESFNHCVSFQVLEHHINPDKMISEIARITKRKGYLLLTAPFLGGLHEEPHDYQRFTKYGLTELLKRHGYKIKIIKHQGSLFSTTAMLYNEFWISLASRGGLKRRLSHVIYPFFLLFTYVAFFLDRLVKTDKLPRTYLLVAQKK